MKMKEENDFEVPFQVQTLISSLRNKGERVHVRGNYRSRLESIRKAIDKAILEYDQEMTVSSRYKIGRR